MNVMIQRVQSIFLFLAFISTALVFIFPVLTLVSETGEEWTLSATGVTRSADGVLLFRVIPMTIHLALITLVPFVAIFLYKRRGLQMRLTMINMMVTLGLLLQMVLYGLKGSLQLEASLTPGFITIMPVVSFILQLMAFRAIRRDDLLIKGLDRIR